LRLLTVAEILLVQVLLAAGDVWAKQGRWAVALGTWCVACAICLHIMKAPGFTRLIAFSDAVGLLVVAAFGWIFLRERLTAREIVGVLLALSAMIVMGRP
jgi:uncharacterized membrane protein